MYDFTVVGRIAYGSARLASGAAPNEARDEDSPKSGRMGFAGRPSGNFPGYKLLISPVSGKCFGGF
jgi:hypothetical protein